ncbi:unnamed protein product [Onchocerca flexuosa]|uniref:RUN domain-containing protein n=1 Tax=Onchocerca flexuosa TaxID=387005 RepID=A0A183H5C6_9BILA|nr:unnamed protein product [Onchocerca flexuosa]
MLCSPRPIDPSQAELQLYKENYWKLVDNTCGLLRKLLKAKVPCRNRRSLLQLLISDRSVSTSDYLAPKYLEVTVSELGRELL